MKAATMSVTTHVNYGWRWRALGTELRAAAVNIGRVMSCASHYCRYDIKTLRCVTRQGEMERAPLLRQPLRVITPS